MGGDPFRQLRELFENIGKIFESIGTIFSMIGNINEMIECPIRLFTHIETCALFFALDYLMIIFHFSLKWGVCFWVIWIPCWIVLTTFQLCFSSFIPGLWDLELTVDMCCPSKYNLSFVVEFINTSLLKRNYILQRSDNDLHTCYCIPPIKMLFNPYTDFTDLLNTGSTESPHGDFILALIILGLLLGPYIFYGKDKK